MKEDGYLSLDKLAVGESAVVSSLLSSGAERQRMMDLGIISGTSVKALQRSPAGDPTAYFFRGAVIAIRSSDAKKILIRAF